MRDDQAVPETIGVSMDTRESLRLASQSLTLIELPDYKLDRELGRGSFGTVWSATRIKTGQQVAIKIVENGAQLNWDFFRRELGFLRELEEHPYTLTLLDAQLDHEPPFIVMPLADGGSLEEASREEMPSLNQVEKWMRQMAEGLVFIHRKGVIHCDFKPSNVLLSSDKNIRIADLGQARRTGHGQALGTIGFMAPEQCLEESKTTPSVSWDVHGFGATAYWLLTGKIPRLANLQEPTLTAYIEVFEKGGELVPVRELNPKVDKELAAIVEGCLQVDPNHRVLNMDAVLEDLERRKNKEPLNCKRPWKLSYIIAMALQRRTVQAVLLMVFLGLLASVYGWHQRNENLYQSHLVGGVHAQESGRLEEAYLEWLEALSYRPNSLPLKERLHFMQLDFVLPHQAKVNDMRLFDEGNRLLTGSADGELAAWELQTGDKLFSLKHPDQISALALNSGETLMATASWDGFARIFDLKTQTMKAKLSHSTDGFKATVEELLFCGQGRYLATADIYGYLRVWTPEGEQRQLAGLPESPEFEQVLAAHPTKPWLAALSDLDQIAIWDLDQGKMISVGYKHRDLVNELQFSADGRFLISASDDTTAVVWDLEKNQMVRELDHDSKVITLMMLDSERLAAGCEDGTVVIWNLQEKTPVHRLYHRRPVRSLDLDKNGKLLAVGTGETEILWSDTEANGTVNVWNVEGGYRLGDPWPHDGPIEKILFSPRDSLVLSASGSARQNTAVHPGSVRAWRYFLPTEEKEIIAKRIVPAATEVVTLANGVQISHGEKVEINQSDKFPPANLIATASQDRTVRLWDATDGGLALEPLFLAGSAEAVKFGPNGNILATASWNSQFDNSEVRLWEVENGYPITPPLSCPGRVVSLEFSSDGRILKAGTEKANYSWQLTEATDRDWKGSLRRKLHSQLDKRGSVVSISEMSQSVMTQKVP